MGDDIRALPLDEASGGSGAPPEAALDQYASSRGLERDIERAAAELTLAIHWAVPVDDGVRPERWRARTGIDRLDASLVVQRVDRRGTPLVVAAEGRDRRRRR